ncbi:putative glycerol dehydrogenase (chromatophore) [Paulinella micropora]|uniref:Glycerol dehydrogenase n=1 Tax=Paulinella micropora TaxID=1928728 RepID=A0A1L5YCW5_9EUKA|nr:putative glycerol dehydrogenase [Paulinella micropora]AQX45307.1 putative glycerol dehydrogenase [Paulinella micropora]BBL86525.1 putative glycerol dehydrogenase [Paulinella micropora]
MQIKMIDSCVHIHNIAPTYVFRGINAWEKSFNAIAKLGNKPLILGRGKETIGLREQLSRNLQEKGLQTYLATLHFDCCEEDLQPIANSFLENGWNSVIAIGGGKVLDAGKLLAHRLRLPCVMIPSSAATCAGWTALSNLYSLSGAFKRDIVLDNCPDLLIFDYRFIIEAPSQTLSSGIADAMAKWYEASVSAGDSRDALIQQAVLQAKSLRDQLFLEGIEAINRPGSAAWIRVVESCGLVAGLIGGLGGARCRTVAAHAIHNGLTQLEVTRNTLHGEKVAFGILAQLWLEEKIGLNPLAGNARRDLISFFHHLKIPVNLDELGLGKVTITELRQVCCFAIQPNSDLHYLPFTVTEDDLLMSLTFTDYC